jgi:hypothetical protein
MAVWGSLAVVVALALVHLTIGRWRFLRGPNAPTWLSISAGTALAYVFAYLLPKLGTIQTKLAGAGTVHTLLRNHAYLLALVGLLTYFFLLWSIERQSARPRKTFRRIIALQIIGYSFYSLQLGYLATELPVPGFASYFLVAAVLGLHLMGIDHYLHDWHPQAYDGLLRYFFIAALIGGWVGGILTDWLETAVMYSSTFVAGGIIITAIREELPGSEDGRPGAFFAAVLVACAAILTVQYLQT